jgi:nucleoside-diphosphate-sugar epimerase
VPNRGVIWPCSRYHSVKFCGNFEKKGSACRFLACSSVPSRRKITQVLNGKLSLVMVYKIFFMGITGYLGGSLFAVLDPKNLEISALTRSPKNAEWLKAHSVRPVLGSLNDLDLIEQEASKADVVINTADSDHIASAKATILGLKKRYREVRKRPLYLHTRQLIPIIFCEQGFLTLSSGTGILIDSTNGTRDGRIWKDTDTKTLNSIPETSLHRRVDTWLMDNSQEVDLCMISPPSIYGRGIGDPELSNIHSVQIPFIIAHAIRNKKTHQIGPGENVSSHVHIRDLVKLYVKLLEIYREGSQVPSGYLFPENGEHIMGELVKSIAIEMKKQRLLETDEVISVEATDGELKRVFTTVAGKYLVGCSPRARGPKARSTGWIPTEKDDINATLPLAIQEINQAIKDGTYAFFSHNKSETKYHA